MSYADVSFEDRMATVDFRVGARAHITVDADVCRSCTTKAASRLPGQPVRPHRRRRHPVQLRAVLRVRHLLQVCNAEGAITWTYPDGGHGVVFRSG